MGDNNEEVSLTDVVVAQPTAADQNELIMQLMQQIAEMRVEMQRMRDLSNRVSSFNLPRDGRPPLHFPPSSTEQVHKSKGKVEEVSTVTATHMRSVSQRKYQNHNVNQEKLPRPKFRKAPKVFTPLRESQTQLYERLKAMGAVGHDTENCSTLKHKIQNMINNNLISIQETI
ncbi:hypothetical protein EJD97_017968 [Solanum chilense]|uniref:Uncharacterized protein n=1 Tax=Solanum chilense TaxID=4083 RepID=A0A6N2B5Q9_SOLCI|nr:hypothetical protein EJD97_017968 [Solanum chilense]